MNILTLLVLIPVLTMVVVLFTKDYKGARLASAIGMGIELIATVYLVLAYLAARKTGMMHEMLFTSDFMWYPSLNIHFAFGVDGIAVAMIGLTSIVIFAGIFASWELQFLTKEFCCIAHIACYSGLRVLYFTRLVYHVPLLRIGADTYVSAYWSLGNRT